MARVSIAVIAGVIVAAIIWGTIYQQTHSDIAALNAYLSRADAKNQQALTDSAPLYSLLGGVVTAGGLLILLSLGHSSDSAGSPRTTATTAGDTKKCPYCAELIKREATICRFCGKPQGRGFEAERRRR